MSEDLDDIPAFLIIPQAERKRAWERNPPKPMPAFGRDLTDTQIAYRQSIEDEKALKRVLDEQRFRIMRERAAAEKAEIDAVRVLAKRESKKYRSR